MKFNFRIVLSIILTLVGLAIIIWLIIRGIFYDYFINYSSTLNLEKTGQFGDFVGGAVGTVFSFVGIILLFETRSALLN